MKTVEIHTKVYPRSLKIKEGRFETMVCFTKKNGERVIRKLSGKETDTTFNRMSLIAALEGIEILKEPCQVELYTQCRFLKNCIEQDSVEKWQRQEWKNARGKDVAHKELWQQFLAEMEFHKIAVSFSKY